MPLEHMEVMVMKKIKSYLKYYSNFAMPSLIFAICFILSKKFNIFKVSSDKISTLIDVSASFIGVLLTILTIYLAVPKNEQKKERLRASYHEYIYLSNILTGIILFFLSIVIWIFLDTAILSTLFFLSGIANMAIATYYTFVLIKLL